MVQSHLQLEQPNSTVFNGFDLNGTCNNPINWSFGKSPKPPALATPSQAVYRAMPEPIELVLWRFEATGSTTGSVPPSFSDFIQPANTDLICVRS